MDQSKTTAALSRYLLRGSILCCKTASGVRRVYNLPKRRAERSTLHFTLLTIYSTYVMIKYTLLLELCLQRDAFPYQ